MFVIWFVSGIVFVYVGMPTLPAEERLLRMEPLDLTTLRVTPAEAAARAGAGSRRRACASPCTTAGRSTGSRPGPDWRMVYADTGEPLDGDERGRGDGADAPLRARARRDARATSGRLTDSDQWTLQNVIRNNMPLHRIALGDAAGTEYYVSEKTGEPVLRTTAQRPLLGISGRRAPLAVLHAAAASRRVLEQLRRLVVAHRHASMCAMGIVHRRLALLAVGPLPPARHAVAHALRGLDEVASLRRAGVRLLRLHLGVQRRAVARARSTFSRPARRAARSARRRPAGRSISTPLTVDRIRAVAATVQQSFTPKELDFFQFQGEPYFIAYVPPSPSESAPWRNTDICGGDQPEHRSRARAGVRAASRGGDVHRLREGADVGRREGGDAGRADAGRGVARSSTTPTTTATKGMKPLPVLRVRYADPQQTWLYLDPQHGA